MPAGFLPYPEARHEEAKLPLPLTANLLAIPLAILLASLLAGLLVSIKEVKALFIKG